MRSNLTIKNFRWVAFVAIILLFSCGKDATCTDGIRNGNETGVDCGGECQECFKFSGLWKIESFTANGVNALSVFNIENMYYDFFNLNLNVATGNVSGVLSINTYAFTHDPNAQNLSFNGITYDYRQINTTTYELKGVDQQNTAFVQIIKRITNDLCSNIQCNNGNCKYGYCVCTNGWEGRYCNVQYGPAKGIIIYDKGTVSNGWRYIEASTKVFPEIVQSCGTFYGMTSSGLGTGKSNTEFIGATTCNSNTMVKTILAYNQNGYSDWYLPSKDELGRIIPYVDYLEWPDNQTSRKLYTSTNHDVFCLRLWVSNDNQWWDDLKGIPDYAIAIRYY